MRTALGVGGAAAMVLAVLESVAVGTETAGAAAAAGTIAGQVTVTAPAASRVPSAGPYPTRRVTRPAATRGPQAAGVVVYLEHPPVTGSLPTRHAQIRQEGERFLPPVVAVTVGSSVSFPNDDPFFHNVFSLSAGATFNLGRYPKGDARAHRFTQAGLVKVFCDIHSHMSAAIMVLDHPYFAMPDDEGRFVITDVPAGPHTIQAWHERAGEASTAVAVEPGRTVSVELHIPAGGA